MRILVTGGAGYIGTALLTKLIRSSEIDEIVVYDNLSRGSRSFFLGAGNLSDKVTFIEGDLLDSRKLKAALEDIQVVYHLAAVVTTPFADQNPHLFEQINHWGTAELVYAIEEQGVDHLIYLSSASVYGASSDELTVDSEPRPKTFYGISKLRGEDHVRRYMKTGGRATILRSGNVYGYNRAMRFDSVINRFMFDAHFKGRVNIHGDGNQRRSFVHIDTLSEVLAGFDPEFPENGIYNLAEATWSINEIAHTLKDIYPRLETLYINQNMKLRELVVKGDNHIFREVVPRSDLAKALGEFKMNFAF